MSTQLGFEMMIVLEIEKQNDYVGESIQAISFYFTIILYFYRILTEKLFKINYKRLEIVQSFHVKIKKLKWVEILPVGQFSFRINFDFFYNNNLFILFLIYTLFTIL